MKILALDCSGLVASVAIAEDDKLLAEYTVDYKKTHSQTLLPMLDAVAAMTELDLSSVDAVAVASGPGSFTGLRIGSATAKGLTLALDKPIVEVPTLEALAFNAYDCSAYVCPIMDARRSQVYTGLYTYENHELKTILPAEALPVADLAAALNELGRAVLFLGDGVAVYRGLLDEALQVPHSYAPAHIGKQRAGSVAALGIRYYHAGKAVSSDAHKPEYLRKSQAERELEERQAQSESTQEASDKTTADAGAQKKPAQKTSSKTAATPGREDKQ